MSGENQNKFKHMVPVPISDFISGLSLPVDLYVKLGETKFILIAREGSKTPKDQLAKYQGRTIEYLWVKRKEYAKLFKKNVAIAGVMINKEALDLNQKSYVLTNAAKSVFREFDTIGIGFESYSHAAQVTEATVSLADQHKDLAALCSSLNDCSEPLLRHSMAVSMVSVLIGQQMEWTNKVTLEKLALGGLLHDIGKKALPQELLNKPKAMMNFQELMHYESHSYKGMQMLLGIGVVPDDIVSIVYEHHENALGQGFPQKLRNMKIHPLARVVALADEFCNLTIANPNCPIPKNPREALIIIEHTMGQPHNREAFAALKAIVNKENLKNVS